MIIATSSIASSNLSRSLLTTTGSSCLSLLARVSKVRPCGDRIRHSFRREVRRHAVSHDVAWLFSGRRYPHEPQMPALATIAMVEPEVERDGRTSRTRRYYLSSARLTAERFAAAVRAHWAIENGLHWVLDTAFDEDRARNRKDHGAENLAILRKLALNVLRRSRPPSQSGESGSAPAGPTTSHGPSSVKCDSPVPGGESA